MIVSYGMNFSQLSPKNAAIAPELLLSEHAGCLLIKAHSYSMGVEDLPL